MRNDRRITFVVTPMGSAGDVQPLVWLGRELTRAGHSVVVIAQELVADMPRRAGMRTVAYGNRAEQEQLIRHPHLWHPRKGFELLASWVPRWAREAMPLIRKEIVPGETVFLGGALAFGARILAEAMDVPMVTVHLQPSVFMSVEESPVAIAGAEWLGRAPRWVRKGFMGLAHLQVDRKLGRPVNLLRREAGGMRRAPVRGVMKAWWHSPDGVLCLFPEWYAGKASDWPKQAVLTRFPMYDEAGVRPLDATLERFLEAGEPPTVVTPGSANVQAKRFLAEAVGALRQTGRRGVVITRGVEHLPTLSSDVIAVEYAPFSEVFPRAAAVIHHGGIGTTAQGLAAGVPQLIMPMAHDQPDNASRVKRMGTGDYLYPRAFKTRRVAAMLEELVRSEEVHARCQLFKRKMAAQISPDEVVRIVTEIGKRGLRVRQINGSGVIY